MATLKTLVFLQAYQNSLSSASPNRNSFKWAREMEAPINNATSETFQVAPGATQSLFSGSISLTQDGTTQYSLAPVPFTTTFYQLTNVGGTASGFRTLRAIGANATTQVTTTINGPLLTYTFTGGTLPNLSSVIPGDNVLIGNAFAAQNQGIQQIVSVTSNSFSVVNSTGYAQGPITLGSSYATQLRIFSGTGTQIGDTLQISGGFSPISQNSYLITQVTDFYVQFSYLGALPTEGPITTEAIAVYSSAKSMIYLECDQNTTLLINGADIGPQVTPVFTIGKTFPGLFLLNSVVYSLSVINNSISTANITLLSSE